MRFWIIIISSFLIIYLYGYIPKIEIPFLDKLFENSFFSIIFFTLCLATVSNGINIIDGLNGLASLTIITGFLCILYLKNDLADLNNQEIILSLIYFIIIFFII